MIQAILAKPILKLVAGAIAVVGVICIPVAAVQTVRLTGLSIPFPFIGPFHIIDGAIHARDLAVKARDAALERERLVRADLKTSRGNEARLRKTIADQNKSIANLKTEADKNKAAADAKVEDAMRKRRAAEARVAEINRHAIDTTSPSSAAMSVSDLVLKGVP